MRRLKERKDPFNDKIRLMTFNEERKDPFNDKQSQIAERKTGGEQVMMD